MYVFEVFSRENSFNIVPHAVVSFNLREIELIFKSFADFPGIRKKNFQDFFRISLNFVSFRGSFFVGVNFLISICRNAFISTHERLGVSPRIIPCHLIYVQFVDKLGIGRL